MSENRQPGRAARSAGRPDIHALAKCHREGRLREAEAGYAEILELDPDDPNALHLLGLIRHAQGRFDEAADLIGHAIKIVPNNATFFSNLGAVFLAAAKHPEARAALETAVALDPASVDAHYNLGNVHHAEGKLEQAATRYRRVLKTKPTHTGARINLGALYIEWDDYAEAERLFAEVLGNDPGNPLALKNLGRIRRHQGRLDEARACFEAAAEAAPEDPELPLGLAFTELLAGNYTDGWRLYEARYDLAANRKRFTEIPEWRGEDIAGKTVFVPTEQGFGDVLQFARFAPSLAERGAKPVLYCQPPLARLLRTLRADIRVVPWGERLPRVHLRIPLLSIPRILGTTLETLPSEPYLTAPSGAGPDVPRGAVGIALGTNSRTLGAQQKSLSPGATEALLSALPGAGVNLQTDVTADERARLKAHGIIDPTPGFRDFAETAAVVARLPLVISVDTAAAHLAGAMGKPVWLLLPYAKDWRWLLDREDSPWYPTMRIFRQPKPGDWASVVERVATALEKDAAKLQLSASR